MATGDLQYNNATGKAKYTAGTGKVQIVEPNSIPAVCAYCTSTQPAYIDITFANLSDCTACYAIILNSFQLTSTIDSTINGNTYRLTKSGGNDCLYTHTISYSPALTANKWFGSTVCGGSPTAQTASSLIIELRYLSATTYSVLIKATWLGGASGTSTEMFRHDGGTITSGDCFDLDGDILSNDYTSCGYSGSGALQLCEDGTATLTL